MLKFLLLFLISIPELMAASMAGFDLTPYGFIKASGMYSDKGLGSFNNINLSAPTHAVAETRPEDSTSRFSIQTQQSRIGTTITKADVSGRVEFDFVDFSKSSPTTQMNPRVRIASVSRTWGDNKVIIGQDWDLFSPVNPVTYNFVGGYFLAGNTGFMRKQVQYFRTISDWELGAAIGMAGANPGVTDTNLELGKSPTYAARLTRNFVDGRTGVSAIYSTLHYTTTNKKSRDSYGYNFFFEKKLRSISIKSEIYYGQSLANLGTLSIGRGTSDTDVREYGAVLGAHYVLRDHHGIFGGIGFAKIDNKSELAPFTLPATGSISAAGIRNNFVSRLGYEYKVTPDLFWMSEITRYETESKLASNNFDTNTAYSLESGILLKF